MVFCQCTGLGLIKVSLEKPRRDADHRHMGDLYLILSLYDFIHLTTPVSDILSYRLQTLAYRPQPQHYTRTLKHNPDSHLLVREPHISSGPVSVRGRRCVARKNGIWWIDGALVRLVDGRIRF